MLASSAPAKWSRNRSPSRSRYPEVLLELPLAGVDLGRKQAEAAPVGVGGQAVRGADVEVDPLGYLAAGAVPSPKHGVHGDVLLGPVHGGGMAVQHLVALAPLSVLLDERLGRLHVTHDPNDCRPAAPGCQHRAYAMQARTCASSMSGYSSTSRSTVHPWASGQRTRASTACPALNSMSSGRARQRQLDGDLGGVHEDVADDRRAVVERQPDRHRHPEPVGHVLLPDAAVEHERQPAGPPPRLTSRSAR